MHELFISAIVADVNVPEVLKILQGLCAMPPAHKLDRFLTFRGPASNPLVGLGKEQMVGRDSANVGLWRTLHEQLIRQSYYISISYEVEQNQFGPALTAESSTEDRDRVRPADVEEARGTLHFLDYPDPPGTRPANSRLALHIKNEARLPGLLRSLKYTFSTDRVRETWNMYRDNTTFALCRDLRVPRCTEAGAEANEGILSSTLPPYDSFLPFDGGNKWVLTASVEISDEKQGTFVQKGLEQLLQVKKDFEGILEFQVIDRRPLDSRVQEYLMNLRG